MKKLLLIALFLFLLACTAFAEGVEFMPVEVSLWCDADTDYEYEWSCEYSDNGVLSAPMEEYVEAENGGSHNFYFSPEKAGEAQIIFNYGANWNMAVPEKTIICSVAVNEDGSNSVKWAQSYSDDHMIVIMLPSNPTTGWAWTYSDDTAGIVSLISEEYAPTDAFLEGAGGMTTYQLKVEKSGETVLMFNHSNLWDPNAASEETYTVVVSANENMEISLSVDEM